MNYIRHLNAFFFRYVKNDRRLSASHVSLYISLFQYWNYNRFQNPFSVGREEVISITGIGSKNTYHKCMKDLHDFGYIYYKPSSGKFKKIKVCLVRLDIQRREEDFKQLDLFKTGTSSEVLSEEKSSRVPKSIPESDNSNVSDLIPQVSQICDNASPKIDTGTDAHLIPVQSQNCDAVSPKINTDTVPLLGQYNIKHKQLNNKREKENNQNSLSEKIFLENDFSPEQKIKAAPEIEPAGFFTSPKITQVFSFFKKNNYSELEATKFFNHYQANGWLIGGVIPMNDWHSSAHKWMINSEKYQQSTNSAISKPNEFKNNKNFAEPL